MSTASLSIHPSARTLMTLHEIIGDLETQGMFREAEEAHDVFVRVAGVEDAKKLLTTMGLVAAPMLGGSLYDKYYLKPQDQKPALTTQQAAPAAKPAESEEEGWKIADPNDPYMPKYVGSKPVYVDTDEMPRPASNQMVEDVIEEQTDVDEQTPPSFSRPAPAAPRRPMSPAAPVRKPMSPALPARKPVSPAAPKPAVPVKPAPRPMKKAPTADPDVITPKPLERGNFRELMDFTLPAEGGFANRDPKADPGGRTMRGVTQTTYNAWQRLRGVAPEDFKDVKNITHEEVLRIYRDLYWKPIKGDKLPEDVALALGDFAIHSGPGRATKTLQKAIGVTPTGNMGPVTLKTLQEKVDTPEEAEQLALQVTEARRQWLKHRRNAPYNRGWWNRIKNLKEEIRED